MKKTKTINKKSARKKNVVPLPLELYHEAKAEVEQSYSLQEKALKKAVDMSDKLKEKLKRMEDKAHKNLSGLRVKLKDATKIKSQKSRKTQLEKIEEKVKVAKAELEKIKEEILTVSEQKIELALETKRLKALGKTLNQFEKEWQKSLIAKAKARNKGMKITKKNSSIKTTNSHRSHPAKAKKTNKSHKKKTELFSSTLSDNNSSMGATNSNSSIFKE